MQKTLIKIILFLFCTNCFAIAEQNRYKVIKIIDGDTVYIDFNNNKIAEKNEKVRLNGIDTFETKTNNRYAWQIENLSLARNEILGMGYLAKEFAKKELLNKYVITSYTAENKFDKNNRHLMSIYYGRNKDYEIETLKNGLAIVYTKSNLAPDLEKYRNQKKLEKNIKKARKLKLAYYNQENKKYYNIDNPEVLRSGYFEIVKLPFLFFGKLY